MNEKMFSPAMDQQAEQASSGQPGQPQGMEPNPADVAGNPGIGELM